ncbi:MAG: carbohydrate kinase family protein [Chloroflexi bacterium]|nr:carbohydrate kinase family protein [Chloroflexota bacterium]
MSEESTTPDIVVSGHLCIDLIPQMGHVSAEALASPGRLTEVGPLDLSTGGSVSNTGLALHSLGANVAFVSAVGGDLLGQLTLDFLKRRDPTLARHIKVRAGVSSSYTLVLSPERMDRVFLHCTGTNATFSSDDIDYTLLENAKIFHLGYPPILPRLYADDGDELVHVYRRARETGVIASMDMALPDPTGPSGQVDWRRILERVLPFVDIFVPSIEEALFMLHPSSSNHGRNWKAHLSMASLHALTSELLACGDMAVVGLKLGAYGVYLRSGSSVAIVRIQDRFTNVGLVPNDAVYHPAFQVDVVGTTGAGDAAYAALLYALIEGVSLSECAQWMCAVGAHNVEAADAISGVRSLQQTLNRIANGWALSTLVVPGE